jgi:hypothetical protein
VTLLKFCYKLAFVSTSSSTQTSATTSTWDLYSAFAVQIIAVWSYSMAVWLNQSSNDALKWVAVALASSLWYTICWLWGRHLPLNRAGVMFLGLSHVIAFAQYIYPWSSFLPEGVYYALGGGWIVLALAWPFWRWDATFATFFISVIQVCNMALFLAFQAPIQNSQLQLIYATSILQIFVGALLALWGGWIYLREGCVVYARDFSSTLSRTNNNQ